MPAVRGWTRGRRPDQSRRAAMGMLTVRYWIDRLGGDDRPQRPVTLRMPAVASAAAGLPRRRGNYLPTDSSRRPHRSAAPIGGTAWFSERIPIRGGRTGHPNQALDTACTLYLASPATSQPNPSRTYAALHGDRRPRRQWRVRPPPELPGRSLRWSRSRRWDGNWNDGQHGFESIEVRGVGGEQGKPVRGGDARDHQVSRASPRPAAAGSPAPPPAGR